MALWRQCADCGEYTNSGSRCRSCKGRRKQVRNADRPVASAVVAAWVAQHGWVCPGYQRGPHPSTDLTAEHVVALANGGTNEGERSVFCRSCNSSKGAR